MVEKGALVYEGKAKKLSATHDNQTLRVKYLDQTAGARAGKDVQRRGLGTLVPIYQVVLNRL